jgi:hypothetical protein
MKHLKSYKLFESQEQNHSRPYFTTSREDLTTYYNCPSCNSLFKSFNKQMDFCPYCGQPSNNVSDFDFMTLVKQRLDPDEYEDEIREKSKRQQEYIDLVGMGIDREIKKRRSRIN